MTRGLPHSWFAVLLLVLAGCGGDGLIPVKGTVALDGQPLADATVQLIPQDAQGRMALASADAKGLFRLSTLKPGDGVLPGSYKVVVQVAAEVESAQPAATPDAAQQAAPALRKSKRVIPPKYSQPDQTILTHKVPDDGDLKLDLRSK